MGKFTTAVLTGSLALLATPAFAAGPPEGVGPQDRAENPSAQYRPDGTPNNNGNPGDGNPGENRQGNPGPEAGLPAKAKAYGVYCRGESRKRVEGEKGTPFSRCVTGMAKIGSGGQFSSPAKACKGVSRKRVEGEKGTPFSRCVKNAAKLLRQQRQD